MKPQPIHHGMGIVAMMSHCLGLRNRSLTAVQCFETPHRGQ
jgi:hypothetical protein